MEFSRNRVRLAARGLDARGWILGRIGSARLQLAVGFGRNAFILAPCAGAGMGGFLAFG